MGYVISIDYKDSTLCLHLDVPAKASLVINNITRRQQHAAPGSNGGFHMTTTLQVGYEEHELIEGRASYNEGIIEASLSANGVELISETIDTQKDVDKEL